MLIVGECALLHVGLAYTTERKGEGGEWEVWDRGAKVRRCKGAGETRSSLRYPTQLPERERGREGGRSREVGEGVPNPSWGMSPFENLPYSL